MLLFLLLFARTQNNDPAHDLLRSQAPTCRDWARAANALIAMGEAQASAFLKEEPQLYYAKTRKGMLCRILFVPRGKNSIDPPAFGGLYVADGPVKPEDWPEFPMVQQDEVWFLLSEYYVLGGVPESLEWYVDKCRMQGSFRRTPIKVPTTSEAVLALRQLLGSERWRRLALKSEHESSNVQDLVRRVKAQADF